MTTLLTAAGGTTTGSGSEHLDRLIHQLWGTDLAAGLLRIDLSGGGRKTDPGWEVQHRLRVLPSTSSPHLLVGVGPRPATARALTAYRGLRSRRRRVARVVLALHAATRALPSRRVLSVATPTDRPTHEALHSEPLTQFAVLLDEPSLIPLCGVRRGPNAKPTLQLFTTEGRAVGYAKLAWNPLTEGMVLAETAAVRCLADGSESSAARSPRVLGAGRLGNRPYLLTEPLPRDIVQLRGRQAVSTGALAGLFPVIRRDTAARTGQVARLMGRLHRLAVSGRSHAAAEVVAAARYLGEDVRSATAVVPVASRWHGDMVPWNAGRDRAGTTWLWDWEYSEPDAPAGMDALHWHLNAIGPMPATGTGRQLRDGAERARPVLQALGAGPQQRAVIAAVYALTIAERNAALAAAQVGWRHHELPAEAVLDLLASARTLLQRERKSSAT
ncbi:hypothetical protein [Ornithinicoccus halotolerans]|uniref:hypothetical protein n=1 Tax=Ornithinicoccus halotolerans TaxID=1748220 RepID=UPI0018864834|nr:hypothetical protein [Ornithinicoccus halotolerans]